MSLARARVFAEMVQAAFTQALGEGICTVSATGVADGDVKEASFEVRFNLPAGISFGMDSDILKHDDADLREGAAQVSASLSQDISREVLAMATALLQADVQTFRVSPEAAAYQATADMVDEALEQLVAEGLVEVVEEVSPDDPSGSTAAAGDGVSVPRVDGA